MPLIAYKGSEPTVHPSVFLAPTAYLTGKVFVEREVSIFFGVIARGDIQSIYVGEGTNLQEHVVLHTSHGLQDCVIGKNVTVGHRAILHGCTVKDSCIIGMGAVVLDGAEIGEHCIIGAQALVPMNVTIPPRSLVLGVPGRVVRELTDKELKEIQSSALHYKEVGSEYKRLLS